MRRSCGSSTLLRTWRKSGWREGARYPKLGARPLGPGAAVTVLNTQVHKRMPVSLLAPTGATRFPVTAHAHVRDRAHTLGLPPHVSTTRLSSILLRHMIRADAVATGVESDPLAAEAMAVTEAMLVSLGALDPDGWVRGVQACIDALRGRGDTQFAADLEALLEVHRTRGAPARAASG